MAKQLIKSSSLTGKLQGSWSVHLLAGLLIGLITALAAGCSNGDTTGVTEAEAKAFLDDFAPEYTRMTIEAYDRALVGDAESAIVSKATDFSVACPGGGSIDFSVQGVSATGSPNFEANATSTNCRIEGWEIEVMGTLPTTLVLLPDGHRIDASGTLLVRIPAMNRNLNVKVLELTATITRAGTCYSASVIVEGAPTRIEGGDDTSCRDGGNGGTGGTGGGGGTGGATGVSCQTACPDRQCVEFSDDTFVEANWEHVAVIQAEGTEYGPSQGTDGVHRGKSPRHKPNDSQHRRRQLAGGHLQRGLGRELSGDKSCSFSSPSAHRT